MLPMLVPNTSVHMLELINTCALTSVPLRNSYYKNSLLAAAYAGMHKELVAGPQAVLTWHAAGAMY
jgi:hypothetical protein